MTSRRARSASARTPLGYTRSIAARSPVAARSVCAPTTIVLVAACGLLVACGYDEPQPTALASGTVADFSRYIQPLLQAGCASLDCHGDAGRPLRLYARNGLREDIALRGQDASESELEANMSAIAWLDPEAAQLEDHLLLLKPLAVGAGGMHHIGGDLWSDQSTDLYRCFHAWLRNGLQDADSQAICDRALP